VIGGGGGIDILIAKYFKVPALDVVEINPSTYDLLRGATDDDEHAYYPWLASDSNTAINLFNREARHFSTSAAAHKYDIIQASGVDTYTAVVTGGLALTENYLYTSNAVADFARLLRPGGILSLTHWRLDPPAQSLRMFMTYIDYLEREKVAEPWRHLVVIGGVNWNDTILKTTPFTEDEMRALRKWTAESEQILLFDPLATAAPVAGTSVGEKTAKFDALSPRASKQEVRPSEKIYFAVAHADAVKRKQLLDAYPNDVTPVSDDKPYFYNCEKTTTWHSLSLGILLATASVFAALLVFLPLIKVNKDGGMKLALAPYMLFFALCGFAFFFFETATIQLFSILVGGPLYALSVVLVCVLSGYATGSFISSRLQPTPRSFLLIGLGLLALFGSLYLGIHSVNKLLLPYNLGLRILGCGAVTFLSSIGAGIPVSLAMNRLRDEHGRMVSWMWSISSAFNALGAAAFVPIGQACGISFMLLLVALLYAVAAVMLALSLRSQPLPQSSAVTSQSGT